MRSFCSSDNHDKNLFPLIAIGGAVHHLIASSYKSWEWAAPRTVSRDPYSGILMMHLVTQSSRHIQPLQFFVQRQCHRYLWETGHSSSAGGHAMSWLMCCPGTNTVISQLTAHDRLSAHAYFSRLEGERPVQLSWKSMKTEITNLSSCLPRRLLDRGNLLKNWKIGILPRFLIELPLVQYTLVLGMDIWSQATL